MDRFVVRTAAVVFYAVWAAGCASNGSGTSAAGTSAAIAPASHEAPSSNFPATLDNEIAKAHALRTQGSYDEATKALGQLMLAAPDDARVIGEYGKLLVQEGRPAEALPFLKRALELQGNDWTVYSAMGVAYDQIDDHAKARLAYGQALSLKPGEPHVLNNYAVSRMLAGDYDNAQRLLVQASQTGSGDPKIANNLALLASMKHPGAAAPQPAAPAPAATPRLATASPKAFASLASRKVQTNVLAPAALPPRKLTAPAASEAKTVAEKPAKPSQKAPALRTAADTP